jgi:RHS repeat-associated protein
MRRRGSTGSTKSLSERKGEMKRYNRRCIAAALLIANLLSARDAAAQVPSNPYDYTRTTTFQYNANGTLSAQIIEPSNASNCSVTAYGYDAYGNKTSTTIANCTGASGQALFTSRTNSEAFAAVASQSITVNGSVTNVAIAPGIVRSQAQDPIGHTITSRYDPRFEIALQLTDTSNGYPLATNTVDDFGRTTRQIKPDGTSVVTYYCIIGVGLDTSSNTPGCPTPSAAEIPQAVETTGGAIPYMFIQTEPHDTTNAKMGPFKRVYYDRGDRPIRTATESFDGTGQPASLSGSVIVQDVVYNGYGAKTVDTQPYFLATGSSTTTGSNDAGMVYYVYDALGRIITKYTVDPDSAAGTTWVFMSTGTFGYAAYGNRTVATSTTAYAATTSTQTNDRGQAQVEERNAVDLLSRVTDASGAQIAFKYDAFGNLLQTLDALQNTVTLTFDIRGNKVGIKDPDKGTWSYGYDAIGETVSTQSPVELAAGKATTFAYDAAGRMTQRVEPDYVTNWYYDKYANNSPCSGGIGLLCEINATNGVHRALVFDTLSRLVNERTDIGGGTTGFTGTGPSFAQAVSYNSTNGKLATKTYPTGLQVAYAYTGRGYVQSLSLVPTATIIPLTSTPGDNGSTVNWTANKVLWQPLVVNAMNNIEQQEYSNLVVERNGFEGPTGRMISAAAGIGSASNVLSQSFTWDSLGNLATRIDNNGDGSTGAVSEIYTYGDNSNSTLNINRLSSYTVTGPSIPGFSRTVSLQYNALGMLLSKSDVGNYAYPTAGSAHPHLVQSVSAGTTASYTSDADGNVLTSSSGKYNNLTYTYFDKVATASGASGARQYSWAYDETHFRIRQVRTLSGTGASDGARTIWYLHPDSTGGLYFESEVNNPTVASASNPAITSNRHFLVVDGRTVGMLVSTGSLPTLASGQTAPTVLGAVTLSKIEYWHKDHLGSLASTTDHTGALTAHMSYDPFGKRRYANGVDDASGTIDVEWSSAVDYGDARGFTGHEQMDDIGIYNMNGRIFDANIAVFLQPDSEVTHPTDLQSFNRYGYARNNPLNATDPSGFDDNGPDIPVQDTLSVYQWFEGIGTSGYVIYVGRSASDVAGATSGGLPKKDSGTGSAEETFAAIKLARDDVLDGKPQTPNPLRDTEAYKWAQTTLQLWKANPITAMGEGSHPDPKTLGQPIARPSLSDLADMFKNAVITIKATAIRAVTDVRNGQYSAAGREAATLIPLLTLRPRNLVKQGASKGATAVTAQETETYYRTMSQADYEQLVATGRVPATAETFTSPSLEYAGKYNGVTVEFAVRAGTTDALLGIGVRNAALSCGAYDGLPLVQQGWTSSNAFFKLEGDVVNVGLGKGAALDTFNANITNFRVVPKP